MPDLSFLNVFDWIVLAIIIASMINGGFQGLSRELFSLIAFAAALYLTARFGDVLDSRAEQLISNPLGAHVAAHMVVFLFFGMLFGYAGVLLSDILRKMMSGIVDRSLGVLFGLARGILVIVVPFVAVDLFVSHDIYPDWLLDSKSYPYMESGAKLIEKYLPERHHKKVNGKDVDDARDKFDENADRAETEVQSLFKTDHKTRPLHNRLENNPAESN